MTLRKAPDAVTQLQLVNLPATTIHIYRTIVDAHHANAYAAWQAMGSPQHLTPDQLTAIRKAGALTTEEQPAIPKSSQTVGTLETILPRQAVVLYHLSW